jgi:hypothetical protein
MVPSGQTRDRVMKLPPRQLTPSPHVQRRGSGPIIAERRDRTPPRPTVPMRHVHDDLAIPQADDDLAIPVAAAPPITGPVQPAPARAPTLPLRALSMRPPANVVVGTPSPQSATRSAPSRGRTLWLAGAIAAVAIAAISLFLVTGTEPAAAPRATTAPAAKRAIAPEPLERPRVRHVAPAPVARPVEAEEPSVEPPPADEAVQPARKSRRVKKDAKPAKKWDPDALFPQ